MSFPNVLSRPVLTILFLSYTALVALLAIITLNHFDLNGTSSNAVLERRTASEYPGAGWNAREGLTVATVNVRYDGKSREPVPIPRKGSIDGTPQGSTQQVNKRSSGTSSAPARPLRPNTFTQPSLSDEAIELYPSSLSPYASFNPSERPWSERRTRLVDMLSAEGPSAPDSPSLGGGGPDIIAFQEVLHNQMDDLKVLLGRGYRSVGVGRDDGKTSGEYSPIFYKKSKFEELSHTYRWLSETPKVVGSVGWDASQTRIATFLTLRPRSSPSIPPNLVQDRHPPVNPLSDKSTPTPSHPPLIHIINTHYDDQGKKARAESSLFLRREVRKWVDDLESESGQEAKGLVLLLGDFNSPSDEDGYRNMVSSDPLPHKIPSFNFIDTMTRLQVRGFTRPGQEVDERIDFVFLAVDEVAQNEGEGSSLLVNAGAYIGLPIKKEPDPRGGWKVRRHVVRDNLMAGRGDATGWTGRWSDHRAVVVEVVKG